MSENRGITICTIVKTDLSGRGKERNLSRFAKLSRIFCLSPEVTSVSMRFSCSRHSDSHLLKATLAFACNLVLTFTFSAAPSATVIVSFTAWRASVFALINASTKGCRFSWQAFNSSTFRPCRCKACLASVSAHNISSSARSAATRILLYPKKPSQ